MVATEIEHIYTPAYTYMFSFCHINYTYIHTSVQFLYIFSQHTHTAFTFMLFSPKYTKQQFTFFET